MSAADTEEAFGRFWDDLLFEAEVSAEPQAAAFFRLYAKLAADNGDSVDLAYTPVRHEGRGSYQVDGCALELERGDLFLVISDFRPGRTLETLNAAQIDTLFERVRRFELEFPRDHLIEKTDLAKIEVTFECRPHIVSRGAQKCFLEYAEKVGKAWEVSEAPFNERWFRSGEVVPSGWTV